MSVLWSNEETFTFIDLYRTESVIWDSNNKLHKDKSEVNDAWNRIADSLAVPVPNLKKKKETLMTAFRFHFKKKQDSIRSGVGQEEIYKPSWVFYDAMEEFLKEKYTCKSIILTDDQKSSNGEEIKQKMETPSGSRSNTAKDINTVKRRRTVKPPELENAEKNMTNTFNTFNQDIVNSDQQNKTEDECELYGRLVASKLRKFSDNERQEIMFEIDGLLLKRRRRRSPDDIFSTSNNY